MSAQLASLCWRNGVSKTQRHTHGNRNTDVATNGLRRCKLVYTMNQTHQHMGTQNSPHAHDDRFDPPIGDELMKVKPAQASWHVSNVRGGVASSTALGNNHVDHANQPTKVIAPAACTIVAEVASFRHQICRMVWQAKQAGNQHRQKYVNRTTQQL